MATEQQVRQYLAYWFQLGKPVQLHQGRETLKPQRVIAGDRLSPEFEAAWQQISTNATVAYLDGTDQTIADLLTPAWEIDPCACCALPVPVKTLGLPPDNCPCFNLPTWPDTETPAPRLPIDNAVVLRRIRDRLAHTNHG
jgi:hypothetical protein